MSFSSQDTFLCLNCRAQGHLRSQCPIDWRENGWGHSYQFTEGRAQFVRKYSAAVDDELCARCQRLDILDMFEGDVGERPPWINIRTSDPAEKQHCRDLGRVGEVEFCSKCPLCRCLFALAPNSKSIDDHLYIVTEWTIHRNERQVIVDPSARGRYDKCIIVETAPAGGEIWFSEHLGDALGILRGTSEKLPLGPQIIDQDKLNLDYMHRLMDTCQRLHHRGCTPLMSNELDRISLFDIETRTVIAYPGQPCDYLTLSYVWGDVTPPDCQMGQRVGALPPTIEDAVTLTRLLGKRYLWVDCLCVSQNDEEQKWHEVQRFHTIYGGAWATIVAISSPSMDSGIARVPGSKRSTQPQLSCMVNGVHLVGLMPTLPQQTYGNVWGFRAWTLQEGLLSPRSFYMSDQQIYFECNSMTCCESLDERKSWVHQSHRHHHTTLEDSAGHYYGHGTLRKMYENNGVPPNHFEVHGTLQMLFSGRNMTKDTDVHFAYAGIMQHLTKLAYPRGFFWGHPISEFNWSLLWYHTSDGQRREGDFPHWSWMGWKGQIQPVYPFDLYNCQRFHTHFMVRRMHNGSLERLYPSTSLSLTKGEHSMPFSRPTIFDKIVEMPLAQECNIGGNDDDDDDDNYNDNDNVSQAQKDRLLLLDCAWCIIDIVHVEDSEKVADDELMFEVSINNKPAKLRVQPPPSPSDTNHYFHPGKRETLENLVLVARDLYNPDEVAHYFLQVDLDQDGKARRTGRCYTLIVPKSRPDSLEGIEVSRRQVLLV